MVTIGYVSPGKKYGVLVCDVIGNPVQDRQRCANTIKEAVEIALKDMKQYPLSCAAVYKTRKNMAIAVRYISAAGKVSKPKQEDEI